ncbi:exoenzymes regulatory protein AepA [Klebsiella michiganensis]|nr:exoenzymes regulatory protein AepA [Klebsiella michiganensis]
MDHLIGSIECGKYADFTVLEDDPQAIEPVQLKDVKVWAPCWAVRNSKSSNPVANIIHPAAASGG